MSEATPGASVSGSEVLVLENPTAMSMSIEARQVQWVVGKSPADANAWVFTASGVSPASGVLGNALGPYFNVRRDTRLHRHLDQHDRRLDPPSRRGWPRRRSTCRSTSASAAGCARRRRSAWRCTCTARACSRPPTAGR